MSGACLGHHLRHVWGVSEASSGVDRYIWGMSGASSGICLGHVWGIIWSIIGQSKISAVLHASLKPFSLS